MQSENYKFSPAWPHGEILEIFTDIFLVTGTNKITFDGINFQTSRNMVIIRNNDELTLINSVRLNSEGLKALGDLGHVKNILRIGAFHGRDDAFYRDYYPNSRVWVLTGMVYDSGLTPDQEITADGEIPFPDCQLFIYETSAIPEGAIFIDRNQGILITCDSIQNVTAIDQYYNNETAQFFIKRGLVTPANISPIWLEATKTKSADFDRLKDTINFKHLITAHGEPLLNTAHEQVSASIKRVFHSVK